MITQRSNFAASVVNNKIYAIGGWANKNGQMVEAYDPVADRWTKKADMPTARRGIAGGAVGNFIYVIGGTVDDLTGMATVEVYDTITDTWTKEVDMLTPRWCLSTCVVDGKIYAIGGFVECCAPMRVAPTVEMFDPGNVTAVSPHGKLSTTWGEVKRNK
jgi:N-acetylneuraminic acid mutarotase